MYTIHMGSRCRSCGRIGRHGEDSTAFETLLLHGCNVRLTGSSRVSFFARKIAKTRLTRLQRNRKPNAISSFPYLSIRGTQLGTHLTELECLERKRMSISYVIVSLVLIECCMPPRPRTTHGVASSTFHLETSCRPLPFRQFLLK